MLRIGLTGGIGSGKSSVARRFAERGAVVIDADAIAREVVEPGTAGLAAVVAEFGPSILRPDGSLDRPALGAVVFGDDTRRQALNAIVHPLVHRRRTELVERAGSDAVVVEDIPLLVENDLGAAFHLVVVVDAPEGERVRRLVADRGLTESDARARVAAQADEPDRRAAADVWLDNSGPLERTMATVDELWDRRLTPYAAGLRAGRAAPRPARAVLADPDPGWAEQAGRLCARVAHVAGDQALRIDHIGSTAVPGLAAKDVLDVQVVVNDLDVARAIAQDLPAAGLVPMPGRWWDTVRGVAVRDKVVTCNADPSRAVNCHVRPLASPAWRDALLLRDWLRASLDETAEYERLKRRLAHQPHDSIEAYADAKTPWITGALHRADAWAEATAWAP